MDAKKIRSLALIVILSALSIFVWRTELFQQSVFPKRYWTKKVNILKRDIRANECLIRHTNIELEKKFATIGFDIQQKVNAAKLAGIDSDKVYTDTAERKRREMENLIKTIDKMDNMLSRKEEELEMARRKTAEYQ